MKKYNMETNRIVYDENNVTLEPEYGLWTRKDIQLYATHPERLDNLPPLTRKFLTRDPETGVLTVSFPINQKPVFIFRKLRKGRS